MFEITGDDIAALSDTDLRTLIGLLCEAEMRRRGLPTAAVTWGGSQTAKDGGLDVRVALPAGTEIEGFIPNPQTGYQVKKPDMPRAEILDEIKPKPARVLRPVLVELGDTAGAYIIVSSTGSTADSALKSRREAMAEALKGSAAEGKLALDFYDRNRIATWVRDHAGMILWVRSRIGKAVPGWQAHGAWSFAPEGAEAGYIADDHTRIHTGAKDDGDGVSAVEGINRIRKALAAPGQVVRLVGLSGVGKTRLTEALFDSTIGEGALDPSLAIYTNVADDPDPPPAGLASDLNAGQTRAILVVDNCPPELHRRLSEVVRTKGSTISVLTIEYDIKDDQPEGTDVFKLETSSIPLIEKLVARRYSDLSQIDAHTIAEFSGGNARVALALASRIEKTESVVGLSEEELFKRLFQQRHDPDPSLLSIAQACALLYSFEGEMLEGDGAELPILGELVGKTAQDIFAGVAELKRRDLIQARAQWRAVLPHAVANRLAKLALQNIPPAKVQTLLVDQASARILRSFSRRLGYLDDSKEAKAIIEVWLAPGGLLSDVTKFNELGRAMFANIAPVAPEAVLSASEKALSGADEATLRRCTHFVRLLRSLAYDPALFERTIALLVRFALPSGEDEKDNEAMGVVESLFHITLSGTHAPVAMRVKAVESLLASDDTAVRRLGVRVLGALMKTSNFMSHYDFDFGARSRDYGFHPKTGKDVREWFDAVMKLATGFALSASPIAGEVRKAIARKFRGLWRAGRAEELDKFARAAAGGSFWRDGWIAARQTRTYDGKAMTPELRERLTALEEFLRPKDLVSKVRGLTSGAPAGSLDLDDFDDEDEAVDDSAKRTSAHAARAARAAATIQELGHDVAGHEETFKTVLPELMHGNSKVGAFGEALAEAAEEPRAMWDAILAQFAATENGGLGLLGGFLVGLQKRDTALADELLDGLVEHPALAPWYPILQAAAVIDERALGQLHRALELDRVPITRFYNLAWGRACENVLGPQLRDLVAAIARKPGGCPVALQIISMRLHSDRELKREPAPEVLEAGRIILDAYEFHRGDGRTTREDHELGIVAKATLGGPDGASVARRLCRKFMSAAASHDINGYDSDDILRALLKVHPLEILDELFAVDANSQREMVRLLNNLLHFHKGVMEVVPDEVILTWCDRDPATRYPLVASAATLFKRPKDGEPHEWLPLAGQLLAKAPDPLAVLKEILDRLEPSGWSGSLATKLEGRLKLLNTLPGSDAPALAGEMAQARSSLEARIKAVRKSEQEDARATGGTFE